MNGASSRTAIIFSSGLEEKTIARHFSPNESGTLLEYVLDSVWTVADEIIVAFGKAEPNLSIVEAISPFGAKVLTTPTGQSGFDTIYNAFRMANSELCLLTSERVPLLKPNVALALFVAAQGFDLAIPRWKNGKLEPMLAVYRRKAFVRLCSNFSTSGNSHADVRSQVSSLADQFYEVKYLDVEPEIRELDPELDSFVEVVDEKSLESARSKASIEAKRGK